MPRLNAGSRGLGQSAASIPTELQDRAFEKYVDLRLLGRALETLDASLLADCALQFAEGERILLRSHKAFSADGMLNVAIKAAVEKNDGATLARLAKAVASRENAALKAEIAAANKLTSGSRGIDPALMVSIDGTTPEQFSTFQELIYALQRSGFLLIERPSNNLKRNLTPSLICPTNNAKTSAGLCRRIALPQLTRLYQTPQRLH